MAKKSLAKAFSRDLTYSIIGLVSMNAVIQLLVYPYLQASMGADAFGIMLSLIAVISILAASFATGANYSRMVTSAQHEDVKGDYNIFLLAVCACAIVVSVIAVIVIGCASAAVFMGFSALTVFTILRYYSDVNFRLALDYRGFCIYYLIIAAGYALGVGLLWLGASSLSLTQFWWIALLIGELAAIIFVSIKGNIYKRPLFAASEFIKGNIKSMLALSLAYLLSSIIANADRLLLLAFVGATEVTVFYTASLVGKTVALLTGPLNGVIIGYLSKFEGQITSKLMLRFSAMLIGVGVVLSVLTVLFSYVLIYLLYPNVFELAKPLFLLASVGQVFFFLGETMLVIVLKVASEKYQLYINIVYAVVFFAVSVPAVIFGGLWGITWAVFGVNIFRFLLIVAFGIKSAHPATTTRT